MCWLEDAINFLFPAPIEQDMDGVPDIPATHSDSDAYSEPVDIPEFYKAIPVLEPDNTPLIADAYVRAGGGG